MDGRFRILIENGNEYNAINRPSIGWTIYSINILRSLASHL